MRRNQYGETHAVTKPCTMRHVHSVLFVCLGNICRSPLAEAAFRREAEQAGLEVMVDSAGTGDWHIGHAPDRRAQSVARKYGIDISAYRARQVSPADFAVYTHIIAMDEINFSDLEAMRPAQAKAELSMLLEHVDGHRGRSVADPYHGGPEGFETTWRDVSEGARALVAKLRS